MASPQQVERATKALVTIQGFDPQTLVQPGDFDFSEGVVHANEIKSLFSRVRAEVFGRFPDGTLSSVAEKLEYCAVNLERARNFKAINSDNPARERKQILDALRNGCEQVLSSPSEITAVIVQSIDVGSLTSSVNALLERLTAQNTKADGKLQDLTAAIATAQKELAELTISKESKRFAREAMQHARDAKRWLCSSIVTAIAVGAFALWSPAVFKLVGMPTSPGNELQYLSSKAIVLIALLYLLHFCGRTYIAARHNETVNRHRANALSTYRILAASPTEERNRDLVLAAAAGAIFSPQDTGFQKQSSDADLTKSLLDRVGKPNAAS